MDCNRLFDCLFETSWEVCNKIGGIYTVLSTKAKTLQGLFKDKVIFIGPDVWTDDNPSPYFVESPAVLRTWRKQALLPNGISVRAGRWNIPGRPIVLLVKFDAMYACKDDLYRRMWERFGVDSLHAYGDYDEACAFSHAAAIVIESISHYLYKTISPSARIIAHFDEWTTGMGLLHVKDRLPNVATVFTTHATSIGRSICGNGKPLYDYLHAYNGDQMARELNMESKHSLEKAAAINADCFTTVSDVTARECEQLLGRKPDVVTLNGFESGFVPSKAKFKAAREAARAKLLSVARSLTGKSFSPDAFIIATSGRCEYRNKGIDLYLDAINELRADIDSSAPDVIAFVMVPAWCSGPRPDLHHALADNSLHGGALADAVITHGLHNYGDDPVINRIHSCGFAAEVTNAKVNVIYVPCYLDGNDGIFDMSYYQLLIGMDATVFASYYEPWGYTPLESVAFGVPTITTSLSGFGQWVLASADNDFKDCGVRVETRSDSNYSDVCHAIVADIKLLLDAPAKTRRYITEAAFRTARDAAWSHFIEYYIDAYDLALSKVSNTTAYATSDKQ